MCSEQPQGSRYRFMFVAAVTGFAGRLVPDHAR
jgi:hypothetical protein